MHIVDTNKIQMDVIIDECPDYSYLEQEEWADRLKEYLNDKFYFIGIRARYTHTDKQGVTVEYTSAGLWGIESDSDQDYFDEVFEEEKAALIDSILSKE